MKQTEERLARLEENLFFQERLLRDLDTVLVDQQHSMDRMQAELALLREKLLEMNALLDESGGVQSRPPHYQE